MSSLRRPQTAGRSRIPIREPVETNSVGKIEPTQQSSGSISIEDESLTRLIAEITNNFRRGNQIGQGEDQVDEGPEEEIVLSDEFWESLEKMDAEAGENLGTSQYINLGPPGTKDGVKAPVCPFFCRVSLTWYDIVKVAFGTVFLFPIRAVTMFITMLCAWGLAHLVTIGRSLEDLQTQPITGWRQKIRWFISNIVMRVFFFCSGFHLITKHGRQAKSSEAPMLVIAPHSSYYDSLPLILMGAPSVVARTETRSDFLVGQLVDMIQAVYVSRDKPESRSSAIKAIQDRVDKITSDPTEWNQIYIYPEGTCTNRCAIVDFKIGAFIPGCNVQPVLIKYPNRTESISWTFDGPGFWKTLFLTLTQFTNHCELEFLPVYVPSEEEKHDAHLYARNIQKVMAKALGVSIVDYTYEDGVAISNLNKKAIIHKLTGIFKARNQLKIFPLTEIAKMRSIVSNAGSVTTLATEDIFTLEFGLKSSDHDAVTELFSYFRPHVQNSIDERDFLVCAILLNPISKVDHLLPPFFLMFTEGRKRMGMDAFLQFATNIFLMSDDEARTIFKTGLLHDTLDLAAFKKKIKNRLDYIKLLCLEISGHLIEYPPRFYEIEQCRRASLTYMAAPAETTAEGQGQPSTSTQKSKSD